MRSAEIAITVFPLPTSPCSSRDIGSALTISDSISRVKQLKPYTFNFKTNPDEKIDGFFAHEAQEVTPYAVTGEKDAVEEDGSIKPQSVDYAKLTPLLTAALQEAIAKIETLESEVSALKSS